MLITALGESGEMVVNPPRVGFALSGFIQPALWGDLQRLKLCTESILKHINRMVYQPVLIYHIPLFYLILKMILVDSVLCVSQLLTQQLTRLSVLPPSCRTTR